MKLSIHFIALAALLAGASAQAATGVAKILPTSPASKVKGDLTLTDTEKGLQISGQLSGLTPGDHGFHVHEFGICADDGKAAGGHYNPSDHPHGNTLKDAEHAHAGDMGNLTAASNGTATVEIIVPGLALTGVNGAAGRGLVVHEKADDFGQPSGNAGGRVGCGTIVLTGN